MSRAPVILALLLLSSSATANAVMRTPAAAIADPGGEAAGPTPLPASLVPLTRGDLRAALARARPELAQCLETPPAESSERPRPLRAGTVRVRITPIGLEVRARTRPRRAEAELCLDTAARRHVTPLLERLTRRAVTASISVTPER